MGEDTAIMVMLICTSVYKKRSATPVKLASEENLGHVGFFQRSSVREMLSFFASMLVEKATPGTRLSVKSDDGVNVGHVYVRASDNLGCVVIADGEYPPRVAFSYINKVLDEFTTLHGPAAWKELLDFPALAPLMLKFQDPAQADSLSAVQKELDETKIVLHQTINNLLERGQKLDDMVERSNQLSMQSKVFYKTAKKTNSCCLIM